MYQCVYTVNGAEQMLLEHCVIGTCKKLEQIIRSIDSIFGKCPPQVPSIHMSYVYISFDLSINLSFWIYLYMHILMHIMCATILWMWSLTSILSRSQFFLKRIAFYLIEWITCQLGSLNARLQVIWTSTSCGVGAQKWSSYCRLLLLSLGPRAPDETRKDRLVIHISGASHCESVDLMIGWEDLWLWRSL